MYTVQQAAEIQSGIKIITAKYIEDKTERYFDILQGVDSDNMNPEKNKLSLSNRLSLFACTGTSFLFVIVTEYGRMF